MSHKFLVYKLIALNIDPNISYWLERCLTNRSQFVTVNCNNCSFLTVHTGLPQDSVLGLLLFLIYIHDLPTQVSSSIGLFADDCVIYHKITKIYDVHIFQSDFQAIVSWCDSLQMKSNLANARQCESLVKSQPVIFTTCQIVILKLYHFINT